MYPSLSDITELHKKYAPSPAVYELVFTHCQIVCDISLGCMSEQQSRLDADLVRAGALLHDIGVYPLFGADGTLRPGVAYIIHGTEGERILKDEGFPERLWRFASHHTGVGLTAADIARQNLPLPSQDYMAETAEERLVMYADKFHSKTTPPYFNSYDWYAQDIARFGEDKVAAFAALAEEFGVPDLQPLSRTYGFAIR